MYPVRSHVVFNVQGLGNDPLAAQRGFVMGEAHRGSVGVQRSQIQDPAMAILGAGQQSAAIAFEKKLKKDVIKEAVMETAVSVVLNLIPIVGPILSLALGGASALNASKAKRKIAAAKKEAEEVSAIVDYYVESKQQEMIDLMDKVYRRAYHQAVPLALSYQPLEIEDERTAMMNVFNQETMTEGPLKPPPTESELAQAKRETDNVLRKLNVKVDDAKAAEKGVNGLGYGAMGSVAGFIRKQSQQQAMLKIAQINQAINPILKRLKQPPFQAYLAKKLAIGMRQNPAFMTLAQTQGAPPPTKFIGMQEPTTGSEDIASTGGARPLISKGASAIPSTGGASVIPVQKAGQRLTARVEAQAEGSSKIRNRLLLAGAVVAGAFLLMR